MGQTADQRETIRIEGLDALRGIAAVLVMLFHVEFAFALAPHFQRAYLSVDFFFLLSGVVMARQYEGRFPGVGSFLRKRLARLWPTMAVGALLGTMAFAWQMPPLGAAMACLMGLLLVPWLGSEKGLFPLNPPAWSIVFELFANALHAALLHRLPVRWLALIAAGCAAGLGLTAHSLDVGIDRSTVLLGLPRVLMSYALGVAMWRQRRRLPQVPGWVGLAILPGTIAALPLLPLSPVAGDLAFALLVSPLAMIAGLAPLGRGRAVLTLLGWLSFPLYAVHYPVLMLLGPRTGPVPAVLAAIGTAWLTGMLVDRLRLRGSPAALRPALA